jgi:hypothetical protein
MKKILFENLVDTTYTITVVVVELDFIEDDVIGKKKNYLKILFLQIILLLFLFLSLILLIMMSLVKKKKKILFENLDDSTYTIIVPVIKVNFVDDFIGEKK